MIRRIGLMAVVLAAAVLVVSTSTADEKKPKQETTAEVKAADEAPKFTAKCPVSGAAAKKEQSTKYKEKEVYFCCEKCKAAFEADNTKFTVKANHQLVQTKQYRQAKCPFSGGDLNKEMVTKVNGVNVQFCCDKCKGKADSATTDEQLTMIFGEDAFKKGFVARQAGGKKGKKNSES